MKSFLFVVLSCVALSLVQIHCGVVKLPVDRQTGGDNSSDGLTGGIASSSKGGSKTSRNKTGNSSSSETETETESPSGAYCRNYPNATGCVCARNPQDARCEDRRSRNNDETVTQAHRRLRDRYSAWVDVDDVSKSTAEEFLSGATINYDLERVRAYFELNKHATDTPNTYGGKIQILVEVEDSSGETSFREGLPFHAGSGNEPKYNVWSKNFGDYRGKLGFHGFFEDMTHGSVILVVKDVERLTGEGNEIIGQGSLWFMRFKSHDGSNHRDCYRGGRYIGLGGSGLPRHPPKKCWEVYGTPFDCRAWNTKRDVDTFRALEPDHCYKKLGNFGRARSDALDVKGAFDLKGDESFLQGL